LPEHHQSKLGWSRCPLLTRERLAQLIDDLELKLQDQRKVALCARRVRHRVVVDGLHPIYNKRI
jgi:hypothetical protein